MSDTLLTRLLHVVRSSTWRGALSPRFIGQLSPADMVSLGTACTGVAAILAAASQPSLAARLILLAAIADALDGILARRYGGSPAGDLFDALADTVAFGVAPAALTVGVVRHTGGEATIGTQPNLMALAAAMLFVGMAITRLALYTVYDTETRQTKGVPTTLAATVLAAGYLAGVFGALALVSGLVVFAYLMTIQVPYPDLVVRDAVAMGVVQFGAVVLPAPHGRWTALGLLSVASLYTLAGPCCYRR